MKDANDLFASIPTPKTATAEEREELATLARRVYGLPDDTTVDLIFMSSEVSETERAAAMHSYIPPERFIETFIGLGRTLATMAQGKGVPPGVILLAIQQGMNERMGGK